MSSGLWTLFVGSLLASTLMPGGVEGLLVYMVHQGDYSLLSLFTVASIGNTIGGIITFLIGIALYRGIKRSHWRQRVERWFVLSEKSMERVRRWGSPALLLSWLPVIGDPLVLAAGYLRLPVWPCILMIALGKLGRYWVLLWIIEQTV